MAKSRGGKAFYRVTSKRYIPIQQPPVHLSSDYSDEAFAIERANERVRKGDEDVRIRKYVEVPYDDNRITKEVANHATK